jgi:hypothetical protein
MHVTRGRGVVSKNFVVHDRGFDFRHVLPERLKYVITLPQTMEENLELRLISAYHNGWHFSITLRRHCYVLPYFVRNFPTGMDVV